MYTQKFTVPEYYTRFSCKCGECRSTCCRGWGISLSMSEYFRLIGLDCSPNLRRRLDTAFHLADDRSPEHYAMVTPKWDGDCPLHGEDGYCMLQRECGEETISAVCRYYPRAPRRLTGEHFECSTSGSCEHTLELLFADDEPLRFVETELTFDLELPEPQLTAGEAADALALRREAMDMLADRSLPFNERLLALGRTLWTKVGRDAAGFDGTPDRASREEAFGLCGELLRQFERTSMTLQEYLPAIDAHYGGALPSEELCADLHRLFPRLDIFAEKMFVNHVFYKNFPHSAGGDIADEFTALCAVWGAAKYMACAYIREHMHSKGTPSLDDLVDVTAAVFRVIEHSRFDECAVKFLRRRNVGAAGLAAWIAM
ncbi:MAG: flagellin lysine-N-methylase [Clostridia bacterium]|nr:flagellin lysine-N-methylase [Clostridia bacterium]